MTTWVTLLAWTPFAEHPAGFTVPLFFGCMLVAVSGMLLRPRGCRRPRWPSPRWCWCCCGCTTGMPVPRRSAGYVPTPGSVHAMLRVFDVRRRGADLLLPRSRLGTEFYPLMVIAGAGTAVLVDFLAVGCRRAPLAGLPLLAVYTAPVSILDGGVSWLKFAAAAPSASSSSSPPSRTDALGHWGPG